MRLPYATALCEDLQGNLWIGNSDQLMRWRDGSFQTYFTKELQSNHGLGGIESIAVAKRTGRFGWRFRGKAA